MLLPRIQAPARATSRVHRTTSRVSPFDVFRSCKVSNTSPILTFIRNATHQAQGRANGVKNGPGKRLGAKKTGEQYVTTGNIIFRQRGTHWFPGDNCAMGRDHTIYATQPGYVKYYRDPLKHPKRQYIGVVFQRDHTLPQPPNAARRRRLGMLAMKMEGAGDALSVLDANGTQGAGELLLGKQLGRGSSSREKPGEKPREIRARAGKELPLRPGYMYREANWEIGRAAERANVRVAPFKPRNRFLAWRKATARKAKNAERRGMRKRK